MRTRTRIAAIAAGGLVAFGALAVPALAGGPPDGMGPGGAGPGNAGPSRGMGDRTCAGVQGVAPMGTLTDAQRTGLAANAEEEKLAHDLYVALGDRYDVPVFDRIANAETAHLTAVRTLMTRYGVTDPTAGQEAGHFATPAVQKTYDELLAKGLGSQQAALEVGKTVETTDIDGLRAALNGLTAPDVQRVYDHLVMASQHHLAAFDTWLTR
jgi:hypothetical protein